MIVKLCCEHIVVILFEQELHYAVMLKKHLITDWQVVISVSVKPNVQLEVSAEMLLPRDLVRLQLHAISLELKHVPRVDLLLGNLPTKELRVATGSRRDVVADKARSHPTEVVLYARACVEESRLEHEVRLALLIQIIESGVLYVRVALKIRL